MLYDNVYEKHAKQVDDKVDVELRQLEKNLNNVTKSENLGKHLFYPYRTGQTHSGLETDYGIVVNMLERYREKLEFPDRNMALEPCKAEVYSLREETSSVRFYREEINKVEELLELFKQLQEIGESGMTHRQKQNLIHLTLRSNGVKINSEEGEIGKESFYRTDIFNFNGVKYLQEIQEVFEEKSKRLKLLDNLPQVVE